MTGSAVGGTSLLEAFTRIIGLELLLPGIPIRVSPAVLRDHTRTALHDAQKHLQHDLHGHSGIQQTRPREDGQPVGGAFTRRFESPMSGRRFGWI
ncbi:MAG: hypothetical protein ACYDBQ_02685 [Thermoplasmatota archaeon]